MGPPPGGPEDRNPPTIEETVPETGASGVGLGDEVVIRFSERPDERSVMRSLLVVPPVDLARAAWASDTLRLVPEEGWAPDRPTILRIGKDAKDRRGNLLEAAFYLRFTTQEAFHPGVIDGKLWIGREITRNMQVLVGAFEVEGEAAPDPATQSPLAVEDVKTNGSYRLDGLDPTKTYGIVGLAETEPDLRPEERGEIWATAPGVVTFAEGEDRAQGPEFLLGTLDSLGVVSGNVAADSGATVVVVAEQPGDSENRAEQILVGGGAFSLSLPTGFEYALFAFVDGDGDTRRGPEELMVELPESVSLMLTAERKGIEFDLKTPEVEEDIPPIVEDPGPIGDEPVEEVAPE